MTQPIVKLDKKVLERLQKSLKHLAKANVKVGILQGQGAEDAAEDGSITMAELAALHEFGNPGTGLAERSFIRAPFKDNENVEKLKQIYAALAVYLMNNPTANNADIEKKLNLMGVWAVDAVQEFIRTKKVQPQITNPQTIAAKTVNGNVGDVALVDKGRLIGSVKHKVEVSNK